MSKYNNYAKELDKAFKQAKTAYTDAFNKMKDAKQKFDASKLYSKERRIGENELKRQRAELAYNEAKQEFEEVSGRVWKEYEQTVKGLTNELDKAIKADNVASPDALDENGLKLLESGVMSADDFADMLKRYDSNPTMLKFVGKHAKQKADELEGIDNAKERGRLYQIAENAKNGHSAIRRNWDTIVECGETYSGQKRPNSSPEFVTKMIEHWDAQMQDTIDSF